jgi:hypothetical protein
MSLDTILAIAGLAVAVGALVPVFFDKSRVREAALAVAITLLVALGAVEAWRAYQHEKELARVTSDVLALLAKKPMTLYQLEQGLHHPSFPDLLEAVDSSAKANTISYQVIDLHDVDQTRYSVGVYSVPALKP